MLHQSHTLATVLSVVFVFYSTLAFSQQAIHNFFRSFFFRSLDPRAHPIHILYSKMRQRETYAKRQENWSSVQIKMKPLHDEISIIFVHKLMYFFFQLRKSMRHREREKRKKNHSMTNIWFVDILAALFANVTHQIYIRIFSGFFFRSTNVKFICFLYRRRLHTLCRYFCVFPCGKLFWHQSDTKFMHVL